MPRLNPEPSKPPPRDRPRQGPPPRNLTGFPRKNITAKDTWFRSHKKGKEAWWFASAPDDPSAGGRWDLPPEHGTCYAAKTKRGALIEKVGAEHADMGFVTDSTFETIVMSEVHTPNLRVADMTSPNVSAHRVTAELCAASPYALTQAWADALHKTGYEGIKYGMRFGVNETGLAAFGPAGKAQDEGFTETQTSTNLKALAIQIGLTVEPTPVSGAFVKAVDLKE